MFLAFRGSTNLLIALAAALLAPAFAARPLLAHWTQTVMPAADGFVAQFSPLFLLGALLALAVAIAPGSVFGSFRAAHVIRIASLSTDSM